MQTQTLGLNPFSALPFAVLLTQCSTLAVTQTPTSNVNRPLGPIHTKRVRLRLGLRLGQIATSCLLDVASNAKNGFRTHSLRLRQIANKNA